MSLPEVSVTPVVVTRDKEYAQEFVVRKKEFDDGGPDIDIYVTWLVPSPDGTLRRESRHIPRGVVTSTWNGGTTKTFSEWVLAAIGLTSS